ncbi:hypothetical protein [Rhizobium sp. FKY42]|uniref:hypothetical protein n=1 Tax=Rhizobium sp. FKY42 TaxID=2562310 RepID=UPI0010C0CA3F|nr:hypothetical protein [Rhizobium sp. FKY42]
MTPSLPLFDRSQLDRIRKERRELQQKLAKGGVDARTRIRRENQLRQLTAQQIEIELRLETTWKR